MEGIGNSSLFRAWRDLACESTDKNKNYLAGVVVMAAAVPPPFEEPLPLRFLIFFMSACNERTNVRSSDSPAGAEEDEAGAAELTATAGVLLLLVLLAPV